MDNHHLFELINASPGMGAVQLGLATALAEWVIYAVPLVMAFAWARGEPASRAELLHLLLAVLLALATAQLVVHLWPRPRPFALHLGTQYLAHRNDPGLPSGHVTVLWSLALATFASRRLAACGFPLLAIGLAVGWSRVYLGVHFPFDVIAALPVAFVGVLLAHAARRPLLPVSRWIVRSYDRLALALRPGTRTPPTHES